MTSTADIPFNQPPPPKRIKLSDLPLTATQRSTVDSFVHVLKKRGHFDTLRKKIYSTFSESAASYSLKHALAQLADDEIEQRPAHYLAKDRRQAAPLIEGAAERAGIYSATEDDLANCINEILELNQDLEQSLRDIRAHEIGAEAAEEEQRNGTKSDEQYAAEATLRREARARQHALEEENEREQRRLAAANAARKEEQRKIDNERRKAEQQVKIKEDEGRQRDRDRQRQDYLDRKRRQDAQWAEEERDDKEKDIEAAALEQLLREGKQAAAKSNNTPRSRDERFQSRYTSEGMVRYGTSKTWTKDVKPKSSTSESVMNREQRNSSHVAQDQEGSNGQEQTETSGRLTERVNLKSGEAFPREASEKLEASKMESLPSEKTPVISRERVRSASRHDEGRHNRRSRDRDSRPDSPHKRSDGASVRRSDQGESKQKSTLQHPNDRKSSSAKTSHVERLRSPHSTGFRRDSHVNDPRPSSRAESRDRGKTSMRRTCHEFDGRSISRERIRQQSNTDRDRNSQRRYNSRSRSRSRHRARDTEMGRKVENNRLSYDRSREYDRQRERNRSPTHDRYRDRDRDHHQELRKERSGSYSHHDRPREKSKSPVEIDRYIPSTSSRSMNEGYRRKIFNRAEEDERRARRRSRNN